MIPRGDLQEWSASASWPHLRQVEQDLITSRALCDLFNASKLDYFKCAQILSTAQRYFIFQPLDRNEIRGSSRPSGHEIDAITILRRKAG